jgi:hypothetical protein
LKVVTLRCTRTETLLALRRGWRGVVISLNICVRVCGRQTYRNLSSRQDCVVQHEPGLPPYDGPPGGGGP